MINEGINAPESGPIRISMKYVKLANMRPLMVIRNTSRPSSLILFFRVYAIAYISRVIDT